eukprot:6292757-Amphidinium_carterae.1
MICGPNFGPKPRPRNLDAIGGWPDRLPRTPTQSRVPLSIYSVAAWLLSRQPGCNISAGAN